MTDRQGFSVSDGNFATKFSTLQREKLASAPFDVGSLPHGWLSAVEAQLLYNVALIADGPVIEVGSWIGRSTCALAPGVRDNPKRPIFDVFDLGLVGCEGWKKAYGENSLEGQPKEIFDTLLHPGGTPALLVQNLHERDLHQYVNMIVLGDFKSSAVARQYSAAFCDAVHFKWEIDLNVPSLMKMMDRENFLIAFDDVWSLEACDYVAQMIGAERAVCLGGESGDWQFKLSLMARGAYAQLDWFG
jgi:hypothetical protein